MTHTQPASLQQSIISAVSFEGLRVTTADGRPARLAIIDDAGQVIEAGEDVAGSAWNVAIEAYRAFLKGEGHLRVFSQPTGMQAMERERAA